MRLYEGLKKEIRSVWILSEKIVDARIEIIKGVEILERMR